MALKGDRLPTQTLVDFFMNEVAERGGVVSLHATSFGSGVGLDQGAALVTYAANSSGQYPVGVLLGDMVNIDQTRQHINWHKEEYNLGQKVPLLSQGWVVTNMTSGTVTGGTTAYLAPGGRVSSTNYQNGSPVVGRFLGIADENGYVKLAVNLP